MLSADTNVLIRALIDDPSSPEQCEVAVEWLASLDAVYIPQVVQAELLWWMDKTAALTRAECGFALRSLLDHPAVHLQARDAFEDAAVHFSTGADFADALIAFEASRMEAPLVTFDKKLARRHDVTLLRIRRAK